MHLKCRIYFNFWVFGKNILMLITRSFQDILYKTTVYKLKAKPLRIGYKFKTFLRLRLSAADIYQIFV